MARKERKERPAYVKSNIGLLMFTSLMIILLAFFIMLSSLSVPDERREQKVLGSLVGNFGILPEGLSAMRAKGKSISPSSSPIEEVKSDIEQMKDILATRNIEEEINVLKGRTRRIMSLSEAILFPPDGVEILPEMRPVLREIAGILKGSDYPIIIKGHTDDQPPRNAALINNWYVSSTRAANILKFFIEEGGLDPNRLSAFGYAGYSPIVANTTPEKRAQNRRIDLVLDATHKMAVEGYQKKTWKPKPLNFKGFKFNLFKDMFR